LKVLNVAYPFAPVGADAVGGAEQVLTQIAEALHASGHESYVLAGEGSATAASLFTVARPCGLIDAQARQRCYSSFRDRIQEIIARYSIQLVHFHGVDFYEYLPSISLPTIATLHLPLSWYPEQIFRSSGVILQCVSASQRRSGPACLRQEIENGVPIERLRADSPRETFALCLGRICPEKGFHHALSAAKQAGIPCLLAGQVFPYESHIAYFRSELAPLLDAERRFIGPAGFARKRALLNSARCLLIPSTVQETSSLTAMEALACGTPVIAFAVGALPDLIEHGKTGFLVRDENEMAEAIRMVGTIDPATCREVADRRFDVKEMTQRYMALYTELIRNSQSQDRHQREEVCHAA
jgi:glycosyltransferase involved in cell wall biosynthesis